MIEEAHATTALSGRCILTDLRLRLRLFRRGLASFSRYSPALKSSDVVWNDKTLDEWLKDPQQVVPGNQMTFPGMKDARHALISLHLSDKQPGRGGLRRRRPHNKRYDGRNEGDSDPSLKSLDPEDRVSSPIAATPTGSPRPMGRHSFWERNLRFKTDGSEKVPQKGAPALVNAGMLGDRADAIFAAPEEISGFIKREC